MKINFLWTKKNLDSVSCSLPLCPAQMRSMALPYKLVIFVQIFLFHLPKEVTEVRGLFCACCCNVSLQWSLVTLSDVVPSGSGSQCSEQPWSWLLFYSKILLYKFLKRVIYILTDNLFSVYNVLSNCAHWTLLLRLPDAV